MRLKHVRLRTSVILYALIMLEGGNMINKSYSVTDRMHHIKIINVILHD
jgi:hypothetical protein